MRLGSSMICRVIPAVVVVIGAMVSDVDRYDG
jgi:hypothetical protein